MTVVELWKAVRSGDADLVRELAGEAELREAANETGYRALHMAALADSTEILRILVDAGAQVDARRDDGWTALHQCAAFGKLDMARLLLEAGAPVDAQDNDGWTPLHEASSPDAPREVAVEMTQVLLENGADVNMHKADGAAALHLVAANGDVDCGEVLLDAGAFIDDKLGPSGRTPLFVAASRGHAAFVAMLASRGADPRSMSARGHDALLSAVQGDHLQVVKVLVASGSVPKKAHLSAADRGTDQELKQFLLFATRSELAARLRSCSMERYIPDFFEHRITSLEAGRDCADGDLEKLGIAQLEHREVIIQTLSGKRSSLARLSKRLSMSFRGST